MPGEVDLRHCFHVAGHSTGTHTRAVYADPKNCEHCRDEFAAKHGVTYDEAVRRSQAKLDDLFSWVVVALILMGLIGFIMTIFQGGF